MGSERAQGTGGSSRALRLAPGLARPRSRLAEVCEQQRWGWRRGWRGRGRAVAAAPGSGARSAEHGMYLYINRDSSAVMSR